MQIPDTQKGLVGHWTMNSEDADSGKIRDRSAYDNHGTINGSPNQSQSSIIGDSFDFDGSGDYIETFNLGVDSHSLSCWFYADNIDSNGHSIFSGNSGGNDAYSGFWLDDTAQMYYMLDDEKEGGNSFNELRGSSISTGKWYHLVQTYDGETGATAGYLNGNLDASGSRQPNVTFNDVVYVIGSRSDGSDFYFNGKITNVRVYNRALSQSEVNQLYNQRTARAHKMQKVPVAQQDLIAHYPFASSGATDQSGNGNGGTNNGATYIDDGGVKGTGVYEFNGGQNIKVNKDKQNLTGLSVSAWIKPNSFNTTYPGIVTALPSSGTDDYADGFTLQLWNNNKQIDLEARDIIGGHAPSNSATSFGSGNDLSLNKWVHVVWTYDSNAEENIIYTDGDEGISFSGSSNVTLDLYRMTIGGRYYNSSYREYFDGQIDDVRIYDRPLSKYEVKRLYQSEGAVFGGIEKGYKSSDLTFFANQWNGSSNNGEVDITGSQFTKRSGETIDITPINNGVALQDGDSSSEGYIMYSEEPVRDRFSDNPPHPSNGDYLVGVRKNGETWEYDDNTSFHEFSPRPTDHLIAEVGWGVDFVNGLNIYS